MKKSFLSCTRLMFLQRNQVNDFFGQKKEQIRTFWATFSTLKVKCFAWLVFQMTAVSCDLFWSKTAHHRRKSHHIKVIYGSENQSLKNYKSSSLGVFSWDQNKSGRGEIFDDRHKKMIILLAGVKLLRKIPSYFNSFSWQSLKSF